MERHVEIRTIGRAAGCDLVLPHDGIGERHARVALRSDGALLLIHEAPDRETALNRGARWVSARRVRLCAGDRYRLAGVEIGVESLTGLFTGEIEVVEAAPGCPKPLRLVTRRTDHSKRNPGTGQIESLPNDNH